jgi:hypothetical protein
MSNAPAGETTEESDEQIASSAEEVQTATEQAIIEAKQEVSEIRTQAKLSNISKADAVSAFRAKLEEYITTTQGTLYAGNGPELWEQTNFGYTQLAPPGHAPEGRSKWELPDGTRLSYRPDPVAVPHVGLESLFKLNDPIRRPVSFTVNRGRFGPVETTATARGQIDWKVLDAMYIHLNRHVADLGLDVHIEEETEKEAKAKYKMEWT